MKTFAGGLLPVFFAVLVSGFGCSHLPDAFAPPTGLTATLTNRNNIVLHWQNNTMTDGGNWVEFATPGSEFTKLNIFMSETKATTFRHPALAPQTTFIYHLRPFFGRPTAPVEIATGAISPHQVAELAEGPIPSPNAVSPGANDSKFSIRTRRTFGRAAPSQLLATLSSPTSVDLHWNDNASDEDGYLVEIGSHANGTFYTCALLPPDAVSFRKTGLPAQTKCYFRVRAFFYGQPSNEASATTP